MKNEVKPTIFFVFVTILAIGTLLKCSQKENSVNSDGSAVSDTSQISTAELELLPVKGPYFPCDERIIEDRWKVERFVVDLQRYTGNPIMVKDQPIEGKVGIFL